MNQRENSYQFSLKSMFLVVMAIAVPLAILRISPFVSILATSCSIMLLVAYFSRSTFGQEGWLSECFLKATLTGFVIVFSSTFILAVSSKSFPSNIEIAFDAVEADDLERLHSVISKVDVNVTDSDQLTLLNAAVASSSPDMVALLLDKGSDPNHQVAYKNLTPLHRVVFYHVDIPDAVEIIKLLIENGADPMLTDAEGKMPIDYAAESRAAGIANALRWKPY